MQINRLPVRTAAMAPLFNSATFAALLLAALGHQVESTATCTLDGQELLISDACCSSFVRLQKPWNPQGACRSL